MTSEGTFLAGKHNAVWAVVEVLKEYGVDVEVVANVYAYGIRINGREKIALAYDQNRSADVWRYVHVRRMSHSPAEDSIIQSFGESNDPKAAAENMAKFFRRT